MGHFTNWKITSFIVLENEARLRCRKQVGPRSDLFSLISLQYYFVTNFEQKIVITSSHEPKHTINTTSTIPPEVCFTSHFGKGWTDENVKHVWSPDVGFLWGFLSCFGHPEIGKEQIKNSHTLSANFLASAWVARSCK